MATPYFPAFRSRLAALRPPHRPNRSPDHPGPTPAAPARLPAAPAALGGGRRPQQPGAGLQPAPDLRMFPLANAPAPDFLPGGGAPSPSPLPPARQRAGRGGRFGLRPSP